LTATTLIVKKRLPADAAQAGDIVSE
jgi:hypothetical protein